MTAPLGPAVRAAVALMHPRALDAPRERALGGRAAALVPHAPPAAAAGDADLLWVAPTAAECDAARWPADVAAAARAALAVDGIAYLLPPPGRRRRLAGRLRAAGLAVGAPVAHLHEGGRDRFLVPLAGAAPRFLVAGCLGGDPRLRRIAAAAVGAPGAGALAAELLPVVGLVVRPAGGPAPWAWLAGRGGLPAPPAAVVVALGWRGPGDSTLLHLLDRSGGRTAVAKLARAGAPASEADVLAALGDAARGAGAAVPRLLGRTVAGGRPATVLSALPGARAWERLRGRPAEAEAVTAGLAGWLERWNAATCARRPLDEGEVERRLLAPLGALAPLLPDADAYAGRLRALAARVGASPVPRVAAHRDLTMHNVLLDGPGAAGVGVVDWEGAEAAGWPLGDLAYAAVDAAAAADGYRDRAAAWRRVAGSDAAAARRARHVAALDLPAPFAELCDDACWLHHAANEARAAGATAGATAGAPGGGARPFLDVLRLVAAARVAARG